MAVEIRRKALLEQVENALGNAPLVAVTGPRGSGKTHTLETLRGRHGQGQGDAALLQLEPLASTPEMLERDLRRLAGPILPEPKRKLEAFDAALDMLRRREAGALLLLDDFTELRTLSYFPGVDEPLDRLLEALERRGPTVITSRLSYWLGREHPELPRIEIAPLGVDELEAAGVADAALVRRATGGIAVHAARLAETMEDERLDVAEALARELSAGGRIEAECRATLAELLHRARGYNACKAVLRVLADDGGEGLKLTQIARRIERTPGSTRDYLRWLEEVDLLRTVERRFYWVDPILRLWSRMHRGGTLPTRAAIRDAVEAHLTAEASPVDGASAARDAPEPFEPYVFPRTKGEDLVEID